MSCTSSNGATLVREEPLNAGHTRDRGVYRRPVNGRVRRRVGLLLAVVALSVVLVGCGDDDDGASDTTTTTEAAGESPSEGENACPVEGCEITITDVVAEGDELKLTWEANFVPSASNNHIHVYWDRYTAEQVSSDAEANDLTQGEWVPTDVVPTYVTDFAMSVKNRGDSTTICATAGDRDHVVIDPTIVDCRDVSALL